MLGLGADISHASILSEVIQLDVHSITSVDVDDEDVGITIITHDAATKAALLSGITNSTGAKVNGTATLTVTNTTSDPDAVAVDTFNVFKYLEGADHLYFLSLETSDITSPGSADYRGVDLTDSGFVGDSLDASGSGDIYNFSLVLSVPGYLDSDADTLTNISIDAA